MLHSEKYPKLRTDLDIRKRLFAGEVFYVVKDPIRLEYFTVDEVAFSILEFCNGRYDLKGILEQIQKRMSHLQIDLPTLVGFLDGYRQRHFFEDPYEINVLLLEKMRSSRADLLRKGTENILEMHFPAWNPEPIFARIIGKIGYLFTKKALAVYGLIVLAALLLAVSNPTRLAFHEPLYDMGVHPLIGVAALWILLLGATVLHELGHGLTCRHFGGKVYKLGVLLLYFNPCLYCDTTESYFFEKKSHKHAVTIAGAVVDLVVAALAVFIWYFTSDDLFISKLSHRFMLLNGVTGIIVNLNPLLKYDGYYLLSNQLELPNLRGDSFRFLGDKIKRFLGLSVEEEPHPRRRKWIFFFYGIASLGYSVFVLYFVAVFIGGWLGRKLGNPGYLITGFLIFMLTWGYMKKASGFARFFVLEKRQAFRRRAPQVSLVALVLLLFVFFVPLKRYVGGPVVANPAHTVVVRAQLEGALTDFFPEGEQWVEEGMVLGSLDLDRVRTDVARSQIDLDLALAGCMEAETRGDAARARQALIEAERARQRLNLNRNLEKKATVISPVSGMLLTANMKDRVGTFFEEGDSICLVADLTRIELEVFVSEREVTKVRVGDPLEVRLLANPSRVIASWVQEISAEAAEGSSPKSFRVVARVDNPSGWIRPGMTGRARIRVGWRTPAAYLKDTFLRWTRIDFWL